MNYPFITNNKGRLSVKLNKNIYKKSLIDKLKKEIPGSILSFKSQSNYYLLEIDADGESDYFDFLNCLIYLYKK